MRTLRDVLQQAQADGSAVAHFNVSDVVLLEAVLGAARELNTPIIVGASDGERKFMGVRQIAAWVKSWREEFNVPVFLNSDHTHSLPQALEAARAGFDAIVFDLSALPFEKNISQTREAIAALKAINPDILVEGEIGDIGTGSEIHATAPDLKRGLSTPEEAQRFVAATGVDILAPAVGNMHGMLKSMLDGETKKHLDIDRIAAIKKATGKWLTLHGGSGTNDEDFLRAIRAGINIVHINTELRVAWRKGLEIALSSQPDEVVPYKILAPVVESVKQVAIGRMQLFRKGIAAGPTAR
jgi:fructose-bisphosphate aldolase class II